MGNTLIKNWEKNLPGWTDETLRQNLEFAREAEASSMERGMGRNPKAARMWREKIRAAEEELERRGLPL